MRARKATPSAIRFSHGSCESSAGSRPRSFLNRKARTARSFASSGVKLVRFAEIAAIVGITRQGCEAAYYRVMQAIPPQDAEEHRTASLERIGQMRSRLWKKFDPEPPKPREKQ